ncbi:hypothetical protein [Singulisphaera acidiphila]|uniref:Uncharacterized protein n=1 Tax=Singulisphaera acidiphila (strain ATCC BAA-1392 / DSM 18658 / VKM B-2454 / MOB10) TaxID=886293 RepID=L0D6S5_SINAD|nr:hypothetical protein [Singulisphaera acidiphila]AGA24570.1 hypothetical protein Sinac_0110 [Singulisphaera acidiphila DSM 18658]
MRLPRLTTQRLMALVFIVGTTIGGIIEIDRAMARRPAYLDRAQYAQEEMETNRSLATRSVARAVAIRHWVTGGLRGDPPGLLGWREHESGAQTFTKNADAFRREPERALSFASRLEQSGEHYHKLSAAQARMKQRFERNASFPWVFFSPNPGPLRPGWMACEEEMRLMAPAQRAAPPK